MKSSSADGPAEVSAVYSGRDNSRRIRYAILADALRTHSRDRITLSGILVAAAISLGIAIRFVALGRQSLWADELFAVFWSRSGIGYVLSHSREETTPPLYYLLLNLWMRMFGDSESAVRLLSACASAATIPVIWALGKKLFNCRAGLIAAMLFALSSWQLYFAQEARCYALLDLTFALTLISIATITTQLRSGVSMLGAIAGMPGIALLLSAAAATYLHFVAFPMFLAIAGAVAVIWWREFKFDQKYLACFLVIGMLVLVLSAPSLALAISERNSPEMTWMHTTPPTVTKLLGILMGAPAWKGAPDWTIGAFILMSIISAGVWASLLGYGCWRCRSETALALVYLLPIAGLIILSLASVSQTFFFMRTTIWLSIPIYLGIAGGLIQLCGRAQVIATALVIVLSLPFTAGYFAFSVKEPWKRIVQNYAEKITPGDLLVLGERTPAIAFVYYQGRVIVPNLRRWPDNVVVADRLDERITGIKPITDDELSLADRRGRLLFLSRDCAVPSMIGRDSVNLLYRGCINPELGGWSLILSFIHYILLSSP